MFEAIYVAGMISIMPDWCAVLCLLIFGAMIIDGFRILGYDDVPSPEVQERYWREKKRNEIRDAELQTELNQIGFSWLANK